MTFRFFLASATALNSIQEDPEADSEDGAGRGAAPEGADRAKGVLLREGAGAEQGVAPVPKRTASEKVLRFFVPIPSGKNAIEIRNLSKSFSGRPVLSNVSFSISKGEVFGLLGPNGAGKTTIVNCICGLVSPDSGSCIVLGKEVSKSGKDIFERINFISGNSSFHRKETPRDILSFYSGVFENPRPISELSSLLDLGEILDREFGRLSTGQKSRVLLAKSLINRPDVLILDEPTLGLDPEISQKVRTVIKELSKSGTTILLTSHYMKEVEELCGRIAFISRGEILEVGKVSMIKKRHFGEMVLFIFGVENASPKKRALLEKSGFSVSGGFARKAGKPGEILRLSRALEKLGVQFSSVQVEEKGLEEYFLEMALYSSGKGKGGKTD